MTVLDDIQQTLNDIQQGISNVGFNLLGITAPLLAIRWTTGADPQEGPAGSLSLVSPAEWVAPAAGVLTINGGADRILLPNGQAPVNANVLRLHPQVHLRLVRLYASLIEGRTDDRPVRPVPYYYVYTGTTMLTDAEAGAFKGNDGLKIAGGSLTIHDRHGLPIDPVAVACAFDAFITAFGVLESRVGLTTPPTPAAGRQLNRIANLGTAGKRLRLADPHGKPIDGVTRTQLQNLTDVASGAGLFSTTAAAIAKSAGAPTDLRLGPATHGSLGNAFTLPTTTLALHRDFFSVMVVDLKPFLIGNRPANDPAALVELLPAIRHQETVSFSLDGAAMLGAANQILSGTPTDALVVSSVIQGNFAVPADGSDATAHWPAFPTGLQKPTDAIQATLRNGFNASAHFIAGTDADVALTLNGLKQGQAVRVYNRVFLPDAREGRGNGAGTMVSDPSGQVTLILKDPLGIVVRGSSTTLPTDATLHVDVVVINGLGAARVFGNVTAAIGAATPAPAATTATNLFDAAADRGISPAGILGLPGRPLPSVQDPVGLALALSGEGTPREAPRLPTMARRDALVAGGTQVPSGNTSSWKGQASGAHLVPGTLNAQQRIGSPGSPGGSEFQTVSVDTSGGLLAYDIARAAVRRTRHLLSRLVLIENTRWAPPAAASGGSISAAVLQTVAPVAETPELSLLSQQLSSPNFPTTWAGVVEDVLPDLKPPDLLKPSLDKLINDLKNSPSATRMYDEFKRDFSATVHGRRDALWALMRALGSARELIYIEGPAFSTTAYGTNAGLNDLVTLLTSRLNLARGLRIVLCLSKELDYGPGYEVFAAREYARRLQAVNQLRAADSSRMVAFHPIGFPGRPLRLMTNVVVVDDIWAMVGTSTIRRRGLTFDGGVDVALFDNNVQEGRSAAIANLRRQLMAGHLGVPIPVQGATPHSSWVRLADAHSAFSVCKELLDHGGSGLIEPIWDGQVPGVPPIIAAAFPSDDVADPEGRDFNTAVALIVAALASVATPPLP